MLNTIVFSSSGGGGGGGFATATTAEEIPFVLALRPSSHHSTKKKLCVY